MQRIRTSDGKTLLPEQTFARALLAPLETRTRSKQNRRSDTDDGVPLVRRRRPKARRGS
jgi:hypothetical protein